MSCYSYYYGYYDCGYGLSTGARAGIGIGIAVGVIALICACTYFNRRRFMQRWRKQQQPVLPTTQVYQPNTIPYNPSPGGPVYPQQQSYYGSPSPAPYANYNNTEMNGFKPPDGPPPPPQAYQGTGTGRGENDSYFRNETRPEEPAPPGYDVVAGTGNTTYAPPTGPPPAPPHPRTEGVV